MSAQRTAWPREAGVLTHHILAAVSLKAHGGLTLLKQGVWLEKASAAKGSPCRQASAVTSETHRLRGHQAAAREMAPPPRTARGRLPSTSTGVERPVHRAAARR